MKKTTIFALVLFVVGFILGCAGTPDKMQVKYTLKGADGQNEVYTYWTTVAPGASQSDIVAQINKEVELKGLPKIDERASDHPWQDDNLSKTNGCQDYYYPCSHFAIGDANCSPSYGDSCNSGSCSCCTCFSKCKGNTATSSSQPIGF